MISVIIPSLAASAGLDAAIARLGRAVVSGLVSEIIVAIDAKVPPPGPLPPHVRYTPAPRGRGAALAQGAALARSPWLLFLHMDTALDPAWEAAARAFIAAQAVPGATHAAAFRFALDDTGIKPRLLEALVGLRCRLFKLPYGDQGFLISRTLYDSVGGFAPLPLMEDVAIVRALGRRRIVILDVPAVTSAVRYRRDGYVRRSLRNLACLSMYALGVPLRVIQRIYG
jgi:glycosyltransferase involved in cell wall biosynthesis